MRHFAGKNFTVHGLTYVDVGILLRGRTWVTFLVQTSKDATVGLFNYINNNNNNNARLAYEIVLGAGDNTYACIR